MQRMSGVQNMQPNLRAQPFVIDPFAVKNVDALVVTHIHFRSLGHQHSSGCSEKLERCG